MFYVIEEHDFQMVLGKPWLQRVGYDRMHRDRLAMHISLRYPAQQMTTLPDIYGHQPSWIAAARTQDEPPDKWFLFISHARCPLFVVRG